MNGQAQCWNVAMLCQGDAMKKGTPLNLAVMTMVPLVVAVVVASIIPDTKKV
jgi:hypothetical protein